MITIKHLGDITKIKGDAVELVDVVTGGSPCQDLSCAGKRAGLAGERSGLFMEQIRIIKEMRDESRKRLYDAGADYNRTDVKPRYMVWENVAGAFSSNKGEDFRAVLEETAKVADKDAYVPGLEGGKWSPCGCILGNGWSIAWRLHDAQYWGVPQRRKRICLLADFNGDTAGKVLFELQRETTNRDTEQAIVDIGTESRSEVQSVSKGLSGDIAQSGKEGERVAEDTERCTNPSSFTLKIRGGADTYRKPDGSIGTAGKGALVQTELSATLGVSQDQTLITVEQQKQIEDFVSGVNAEAKHQQDLIQSDLGVARTLAPGTHASDSHLTKTLVTSSINAGDNQQAVVYGIGSYDSNAMKSDNPHSGMYEADTSRTLDLNGGNPGCNQGGMAVVCIEGNGQRESHKGDGYKESDTMYTLNTVEQHAVCIENHPADSRVKIEENGICQTLSSRMGTGGGNVPMVMEEPLSIGHDIRSARFTDDGITDPLTATDYKDPIKITYRKATGTVDCGLTKYTSNQLASQDMFVANRSIVRRLTPMECERLQGFPDNWTNIGDWVDSKGKTHKGNSDSPRYKALGNSLGLPFWQWMAYRMVKYLPQNCTMASLFSGIGGFELVFSRAGCKPLWCSEIEEFGIAVTKKHFPDNE